MTKQEYLSRAWMLDREIEYQVRRMKNLQLRLTDIAHGWPGSERVGTSAPEEAHYARLLASLDEMAGELENRTKEYVRTKREIERTIARVSDVSYRLMLQYRYLEHLTWDQVGEALCVDPSTAKRWHRKAMDMVEIPEEEYIPTVPRQ